MSGTFVLKPPLIFLPYSHDISLNQKQIDKFLLNICYMVPQKRSLD